MHSNHANHANAVSAGARITEIPSQLSRLQDTFGELGRRSDVLLARLESVRRIPVPEGTLGDKAMSSTSPAPAYAPPQTPLGMTLDQLAREVESQIRAVNHAIDTLEIA